MAEVSMLQQALKSIKAAGSEKSEETVEAKDDLEQAMADFQNAKTEKERAAAFRAALELAK